MLDLFRLQGSERVHEDRLLGRYRSFRNIVQAHVAAAVFQLRLIQPHSFTSRVDGYEEVFAVLAFRGFDVLGQGLFLQVERSAHRLTTTAT